MCGGLNIGEELQSTDDVVAVVHNNERSMPVYAVTDVFTDL